MKMDRSHLSAQRLLVLGVILIITVSAVGIYIASRPDQPTAILPTKTTITFDFDNGTPPLADAEVTPFNQTLQGLTASFSSPSDPAAFSVKLYHVENVKLSQFSGKYVYDEKPTRDILDIKFSGDIVAVEFTFATVEQKSEAITIPSDILVTAYKNNNLVGSNKTYGRFSSDSLPMGRLFFGAGMPFNWVRISMPSQTSGATDFLVDNIIVTIVSKPAAP